jgi:hypothetical protein
MPAGEWRVHRISTGSILEALMIRAAGNVEPHDWFNVPAGKVLRMTDASMSTTLPNIELPTIIRIRRGQTVAGEEIARFVIAPVHGTYGGHLDTPIRVDGLAAGQDLVLTIEQPNSRNFSLNEITLIGHRD